MMSSKNLLSSGITSDFQVDFDNGLKQQLLDEQEMRASQMKQARNPMTSFGGAAINMSSLSLLGAGGSLGR